jgi:hypothetical protein
MGRRYDQDYLEDRGSDIAQDIRESTIQQRDQGYPSNDEHSDQSNKSE